MIGASSSSEGTAARRTAGALASASPTCSPTSAQRPLPARPSHLERLADLQREQVALTEYERAMLEQIGARRAHLAHLQNELLGVLAQDVLAISRERDARMSAILRERDMALAARDKVVADRDAAVAAVAALEQKLAQLEARPEKRLRGTAPAYADPQQQQQQQPMHPAYPKPQHQYQRQQQQLMSLPSAARHQQQPIGPAAQQQHQQATDLAHQHQQAAYLAHQQWQHQQQAAYLAQQQQQAAYAAQQNQQLPNSYATQEQQQPGTAARMGPRQQ
ncbi:hypothetical protein H9P43_006929 [Blastocladiella emersonii ATCC 22665]|nr:hypothetical protein H9P43_006929 [Blastocladiella emersonii ATCC 22665]